LTPDCGIDPSNPFERMIAVRQLQSDMLLQERLSDCEDYFNRVPVAAINASMVEANGLRGPQTWPPPVKLAFSHQVHKEVAILEIFLAVVFR
jgi:hypothetical protein